MPGLDFSSRLILSYSPCSIIQSRRRSNGNTLCKILNDLLFTKNLTKCFYDKGENLYSIMAYCKYKSKNISAYCTNKILTNKEVGGKCIYITINLIEGGGIVYGGENYQGKGSDFEKPARC